MMRRSSSGARLVRRLAAAAIALGVFVATPSAPRAQAARDHDCNAVNSGLVCKVQQDCAYFFFYSKCTDEYWRLPVVGVRPAPFV